MTLISNITALPIVTKASNKIFYEHEQSHQSLKLDNAFIHSD